jgi:hypothetical protein
LACLAASEAVLAKGATVRVVISGDTVPEPIVVADPGRLRPFTVWAGAGVTISGVPQHDGFIVNWWHGVVPEPPASAPRYQVAFYADRSDDGGATPAYVVTYAYDAVTDRGFVYLPGRQDPYGDLNIRTMYRGGLEGHWLLSTGAWDDFIVPTLASDAERE